MYVQRYKMFSRRLSLRNLFAGLVRGLCIVLVVLLVVAIPSAARAVERDKLLIGVSVANMGHEYISRVWRSIEATLKMFDVDMIALDSEWDISKQADHIDQFILQKVDCALVGPVGPAASTFVKRLNKANIPVVCFLDSFPEGPKEAGYRAYVGSDWIHGAGAGLTGEYLAGTLLGGKGTIVYIKGEPGVGVTRTRDRGFKKALEKYPGVKVIFEHNGDWTRASGVRLMADALQRFSEAGSIDAVFAHNDSMVLGAVRALKEAGRLDEVIVAGVDGVPAALEALKKGEMAATSFQNAEAMGRYAAIVAVKAAAGQPFFQVPVRYNIPWILVTKENCDEIKGMQSIVEKVDDFFIENGPIVREATD